MKHFGENFWKVRKKFHRNLEKGDTALLRLHAVQVRNASNQKKKKDNIFCGLLSIEQVHDECCTSDRSRDTAYIVTWVGSTPTKHELLRGVDEQWRCSACVPFATRWLWRGKVSTHRCSWQFKKKKKKKAHTQFNCKALFHRHIHVTVENRDIRCLVIALWLSFPAYFFVTNSDVHTLFLFMMIWFRLVHISYTSSIRLPLARTHVQ